MRQISSTLAHTAFWSLFILVLFLAQAHAQSDGTNVRFTQGETNDGAAVSLSVPLTTFPGRGLNLPVSLSYSSSVWRIDHLKSVKNFVVAPPPYMFASASTSAPAFSNTSATATMFFGVFCRSLSTPFAET